MSRNQAIALQTLKQANRKLREENQNAKKLIEDVKMVIAAEKLKNDKFEDEIYNLNVDVKLLKIKNEELKGELEILAEIES